jgi:peptidoglycan/LPS O-acetylase OafA/YrhL
MPEDSLKSPYYPSLDGLRGLAACMVVYGHAGYFGWVPLVAGCATIGVLLFFFLSGFLMGHHYLPGVSSGLLNKRTIRYWAAFLLRRFMRVYPPYLFAPILGYLLLMPRLPPDFERAEQFQNLSIFDELARIAAFKEPLGIYWTIEVELFFYLIYPFIITLSLLSRNTAGMLLLLFAALTFFKHEVPLPGQWAGFTSIFIAGVFTAVVLRRYRDLLGNRLIHRNALTAVSFLLLVLVVVLISQSSPTQESIWKLEWLFAALFFAIFTCLVGSDGAISRFFSSRLCAAIGRASYSLYLIHIIAFYVVTTRIGQEYRGPLTAMLVVFVLTWLYYAIMERPFVRLSKRIVVND